MGQSVAEINSAIKTIDADSKGISATLSRYNTDLKAIQTSYATHSNKIMLQADAIQANADKEKAVLKAKYDADCKAIDAKANVEKEKFKKAFNEVGTKILKDAGMFRKVEEMENIAKGCKMMADRCDQLQKEVTKAAGDSKLRKATEALAAQTSKQYRALHTQCNNAYISGQKTVDSFT